ncbi:MAG: hypothetical protein ACT4OX_00075 [Actinomycetota bacterium]
MTGELATIARVPWRRRIAPEAWLLAALLALLTVPLFVALGVLHSPRWYPLLDLAQTEIRVRDITSSHPPLIGLAGRIGPYGPGGGSHPGPLSFYVLWPVYQALGASSWALQVATVVLDVIAIGLALWIARRRGGVGLMIAMALLLAVLTQAYGSFLLTLPWNPYLPVLWWVVFLLAIWSVLDEDLAMVPVAAFAGTLCAQTHIPYLGLVGGLVVLAVAAIAVAAYQRRGAADARRPVLRWGLVGLVLGSTLWLPPVIDEVAHSPGNLTVIRDHFSDPPEDEPVVGVRDGVDVLLSQLNPWRLVSTTLVRDARPRPVEGSIAPGLVLVIVWMAAGALALHMRHRRLVSLHVTLGVALVLGVISAARIFGFVWYYLLLWAWGLAALLVLASAWTFAAYAIPRINGSQHARVTRAGTRFLVGMTAISTVAFTFDAADVRVQAPQLNEALGAVTEPTAAALTARGESGPYLVTWLPDPLGIGSQGFGLLNELHRRGFDVRAREAHTPGATRYHVAEPDEVELEVHLATGPEIDKWRADLRYDEVVYYDPRSDAERVELDELRAELVAALRGTDDRDLVAAVDDDLFMLGINPDVDDRPREIIANMLALGLPAAVFIGPPGDNV